MSIVLRKIGSRIAQRLYVEQDVEGTAFKAKYPLPKYPTDKECADFALYMAEIMGTAIVENVPGYVGATLVTPSVGDGLDYPEPSLVQQVDDTGDFVALWWKAGPDATDWVSLGGGLGDDHEVRATSTDSGHGPLFNKLKSLAGIEISEEETDGVKQVGIRCTVTQPSVPQKSTTLPLPDGDEAALGDEGKWADGKHVHPKTRPSKIRYYLSDTNGTGDWTGRLLLTSNPHDEGSAVDLSNSANLFQFVSSPGSPGLAVWNGGAVHAHLRIKLIGARAGRTYKLYTGNGDLVYTHLVGDWTSGDVYQTAPYPDQPSVTTTYATLDFDVPVATLAAGNTHRFELKLILRAYVGSSEDSLSGEQLVVRVGGDNASYLDTPFTPSGGFAGLHNDLDGREAENAHPFAAITPGRILTPSNPMVTTSSGLFAVPEKTNYVELDGTEDLIGCSTEGFIGTNSEIEIYFFTARKILKAQNPLPSGYAPFAWGGMDTGYFGDYDVINAYANSVFRFRLIGGNWRLCSSFNV